MTHALYYDSVYMSSIILMTHALFQSPPLYFQKNRKATVDATRLKTFHLRVSKSYNFGSFYYRWMKTQSRQGFALVGLFPREMGLVSHQLASRTILYFFFFTVIILALKHL